jgi:hypothetical protein
MFKWIKRLFGSAPKGAGLGAPVKGKATLKMKVIRADGTEEEFEAPASVSSDPKVIPKRGRIYALKGQQGRLQRLEGTN